MYAFLAALPAILGLAGFVIFQLLRNQQREDNITSKIVAKLRAGHPNRLAEYQKLNSKQLHDLLSKDQQLLKAIGAQDFELLGQALRQQHVQAMFVYAITSILFVVGVIAFLYQFNRPEPTEVTGLSLESIVPEAHGQLVDLDDLRLTWQSSGTPAPIKIYVENIDTGERTDFWNARSADGQLILRQDRYQPVIKNRRLLESNRLRIIAQADNDSFRSKEYKVTVGATITAVVFGERIKVAAMVDNGLVQRYKFEFKLVTPKKDEVDFLTLGGEVSGARDYQIENDPALDWGLTKIVYLGPDDAAFFRTAIHYDIPE